MRSWLSKFVLTYPFGINRKRFTVSKLLREIGDFQRFNLRMRINILSGTWLAVCILLTAESQLPAQTTTHKLPFVEPASVGFDTARWPTIRELAEQGIAEGKMPGCVICFGRNGGIVFQEAFGLRKVAPNSEAMTTDTVFDMASITKPLATATSIMKLVENGKFRIQDRVSKFLPEFALNGKDVISIEDLMLHQSGLIPDNALKDYDEGPEIAWKKICALELVAPVRQAFKYSDVNFIVLAKLVEKASGQNVHDFSQQHIFEPLEMTETGFLPSASLKARAAPTEKRNGEWMRGEVHDPRAYKLNGIAGHAGLFSTANDLSTYAHMMLGNGTFRGNKSETRILSPRTVTVMTQAYSVGTDTSRSNIRGLGWDKQTGYSSNRGDLLSPAAFGHGGFTGTVLWIDPELDLFFIFLSNRVHPTGDGYVNHLAGQILNVIASSIEPQRTQN